MELTLVPSVAVWVELGVGSKVCLTCTHVDQSVCVLVIPSADKSHTGNKASGMYTTPH